MNKIKKLYINLLVNLYRRVVIRPEYKGNDGVVWFQWGASDPDICGYEHPLIALQIIDKRLPSTARIHLSQGQADLLVRQGRALIDAQMKKHRVSEPIQWDTRTSPLPLPVVRTGFIEMEKV